MTNYKSIVNKLGKFGLTENQSAIYLSLVQYGELRIQQIASETLIPRTSIYENLKVLFKLGLVEKIIDHKFVRLKAYPIGTLEHGLNEKLLHFQTLIKELTDLEKNIAFLPNSSSIPSTTVRYYKGISAGRQLFWNTLNAKSVVYVYSSYGRSKFVGNKFYKDFVKESQERNIKEMVLINPTQRALNLIKRDADSPLARTKISDLRFLPEKNVAVKGETFIYDNIYAQIDLTTMGINGFEIESTSFTKMQKSIFETLWEKAKPVSSIL